MISYSSYFRRNIFLFSGFISIDAVKENIQTQMELNDATSESVPQDSNPIDNSESKPDASEELIVRLVIKIEPQI